MYFKEASNEWKPNFTKLKMITCNTQSWLVHKTYLYILILDILKALNSRSIDELQFILLTLTLNK